MNKVDITALKPEAKRFLERLVKEGRRNGLHLEESQRERIKEMQKRMSDLSLTFGKNLNEDTTKLHFSAEELDGLPDDFMEALDKVGICLSFLYFLTPPRERDRFFGTFLSFKFYCVIAYEDNFLKKG